jgi:Flp pilus assembly pilin Flp
LKQTHPAWQYAHGDFVMTVDLVQLTREDDGQDLIEYALLAGLLAVACIALLLELTQMREFLARAGQALTNAI